MPETPIKDGMPAVFGHGGSDSTLAIALPAIDTIVLYFTQSRGPGIRPMFRSALSRVPAFAEQVAADPAGTTLRDRFPEQVPIGAIEARAYVGTYIGSIFVDGKERLPNSFTYHVRLAGDCLRGTMSRPGGLQDRPLPDHDLIPLGAGQFIIGRIFEGRIVEVLRGSRVQFARSVDDALTSNSVEISSETPPLRWLLSRKK